MPLHDNVCLHAVDVEFPAISVAPGEYFFLPFHMKLGNAVLLSAAATPLCRLRGGFVFYADRDPQYRWNGPEAKVLTLSREDAKNAVRVRFDDDYLLICEQPVIETEQGVFCLARKGIELKSFPALPGAEGTPDGALARYTLPIPPSKVRLQVRPRMRMSDLYAEYDLILEGAVTGNDVFLRVDYEGDQAELLLDGRKVADDYYRGEPWEIGLKRWGFPETMLLRIFAMQKGAPVFTDEPLAYENGRALRLNGVTAQEEFRVRISPETLSAGYENR
jgi:hypothetical protein